MSLFGACWPRKWLTEAVCASIYLSWFMSKTPFFSPFPVQVWFQNRRARTLKCKGAKKALWQADSPAHDDLPPPHVVANRGTQAGPPPAYLTQVKEEIEEACFYAQCPPAYSTGEENAHYGSMFGPQGGRSSPPLRGLWSQSGGKTSPVVPLWCQSPSEMRNYSVNSRQAALMYPGSAEQQMYMPHASTPDTPDSGFWDVCMENSPPPEGQYLHLEDSWIGMPPGDCRESRHPAPVQHAPLPQLSLQEILSELDEEWLGGEGLESQAKGHKMPFC